MVLRLQTVTGNSQVQRLLKPRITTTYS